MKRKQKERPLRRGNIVWVRRKRQDGGMEEAKGKIVFVHPERRFYVVDVVLPPAGLRFGKITMRESCWPENVRR